MADRITVGFFEFVPEEDWFKAALEARRKDVSGPIGALLGAEDEIPQIVTIQQRDIAASLDKMRTVLRDKFFKSRGIEPRPITGAAIRDKQGVFPKVMVDEPVIRIGVTPGIHRPIIVRNDIEREIKSGIIAFEQTDKGYELRLPSATRMDQLRSAHFTGQGREDRAIMTLVVTTLGDAIEQGMDDRFEAVVGPYSSLNG